MRQPREIVMLQFSVLQVGWAQLIVHQQRCVQAWFSLQLFSGVIQDILTSDYWPIEPSTPWPNRAEAAVRVFEGRP